MNLVNFSHCIQGFYHFYIYNYSQIDMFGRVVAVTFQNIFRAEIHQNNIFFNFLKIIFEINASKRSKTH